MVSSCGQPTAGPVSTRPLLSPGACVATVAAGSLAVPLPQSHLEGLRSLQKPLSSRRGLGKSSERAVAPSARLKSQPAALIVAVMKFGVTGCARARKMGEKLARSAGQLIRC